MLDKQTPAVAADTFDYTTVEAALSAVLLGSPDHPRRKTWLRSRVIRLRKLGLTPPGAVRGKSSVYDRDWPTRWLLGLVLTIKLAREPRYVAAMLRTEWKRPPSSAPGSETLPQLCARARRTTDQDLHVLLLLEHCGEHVTITNVDSSPTGMKAFCRAIGSSRPWSGTAPGITGGLPVMVTIDLTALLRQLDQALAAAQSVKPDPPELAGRIVKAGRKARRT